MRKIFFFFLIFLYCIILYIYKFNQFNVFCSIFIEFDLYFEESNNDPSVLRLRILRFLLILDILDYFDVRN
jgi:hypothetical protein